MGSGEVPLRLGGATDTLTPGECEQGALRAIRRAGGVRVPAASSSAAIKSGSTAIPPPATMIGTITSPLFVNSGPVGITVASSPFREKWSGIARWR